MQRGSVGRGFVWNEWAVKSMKCCKEEVGKGERTGRREGGNKGGNERVRDRKMIFPKIVVFI